MQHVVDQAEVADTDPRGCWAALAILASAMILGMATWFSATAVVPQFKGLWGLSSSQAAWLTIAVQLGFICGALGSALLNLADAIAPRRLILFGCLGAAGANALILIAPTIGSVIALRFMTGIFLAAVYPPAMKAMATWFRINRGTALGIMVGALTIGSASPHLVNGLGGLDWRVVILGTSAMTLVGGLITEYLGRDGPYPFPKGAFNPRMAWGVFRDRGVLYPCLGYFGHMWELYAMWAWFSVFLLATLQLHEVENAATLAALGTFLVIAVGALGCWIGGVIGDRWGRSRATILAMCLSGTCALTIGFVQGVSVTLVMVLGLIWGFWVIADSAQFSTAVTEVGRQDYIGTALTMQLAIGFALTVPTIWLIPVLEALVGWGGAFSLLALGPMLGVIAMFKLMSLRQAGA
ncbi:MFS family permease [Natronocella acetinitrilica]|uniref:MFS family permease n=1 Tax=Natronocella acetinitrilica TaxID=414046 RepID=A0AAE3KE80_9GAMM|nr:MFS transporter [Natronocella acetinitrilica]MCP1677178.1 MFS family permease [Natronocella acetinitrilica]